MGRENATHPKSAFGHPGGADGRAKKKIRAIKRKRGKTLHKKKKTGPGRTGVGQVRERKGGGRKKKEPNSNHKRLNQ